MCSPPPSSSPFLLPLLFLLFLLLLLLHLGSGLDPVKRLASSIVQVQAEFLPYFTQFVMGASSPKVLALRKHATDPYLFLTTILS